VSKNAQIAWGMQVTTNKVRQCPVPEVDSSLEDHSDEEKLADDALVRQESSDQGGEEKAKVKRKERKNNKKNNVNKNKNKRA
jgi:hypothetical protein